MTKGLRRRGRLVAAVGAAALLLAGGSWWWTNRVPVVQVPDRVCGGVLSGTPVAAILPKKGGEYEGTFVQPVYDPAEQKSKTLCSMMAADRSISAAYSWTTSTLASSGYLERRGAPLRLGEAPGYTGPREAALLLACYSPSDVRYPWLEVTVTRYRDLNSVKKKGQLEVDPQRDPVLMSELAADAARYLARELKCETASRLPAGPPVMGAGASD
ncbi:hypothetical protein ACIQK6_24310 [Streptomyces sp. NPDC091682]|uniref:hypothetical protein n=1 Tax=Streptomyces sp. NPDC091682 TaxID=3366005 RepID=UPI0038244E02